MERGLLWLPLLIVFFTLAWSGWNEYQKIEAYRLWSEDFEKTKYDIYAVLGQKENSLTWGKPSRQGPVNLNTFSLKDVKNISLRVGDRLVEEIDKLPTKGSSFLEFSFKNNTTSIKIPFTEISLAAKWFEYLKQQIAEL